MEKSIVITPRVMNRLKNMSIDERRLMLDTLISDEVLHIERPQTLTPTQELVYFMFHDMVSRDSYRYDESQRHKQLMVS